MSQNEHLNKIFIFRHISRLKHIPHYCKMSSYMGTLVVDLILYIKDVGVQREHGEG